MGPSVLNKATVQNISLCYYRCPDRAFHIEPGWLGRLAIEDPYIYKIVKTRSTPAVLYGLHPDRFLYLGPCAGDDPSRQKTRMAPSAR